MSLESAVERILIPEADIEARVRELGAEITKDYNGKEPILVGMLRGCVVFYSELLKNIKTKCTLDFMCLSSYCGMESTGEVRILLDVRGTIKDRHVILIEDIVDTGLTLDYVLKNLRNRGAASVEICTLLDKPSNRKVTVPVKYRGFEIPNEFVIGYGLDYNELYRNLPYIGVYKQK
ncbi:Hypoxanthine phosphoribosyltransferase [Elusimicrobium minutum Pei191]|uniref:Hypoxanthine phosphoribosyltransferase n=1 Tax=Elusimicrobium minutum (strain Pei191) TaxID=445932 RepID=B2KEC7_ELUMP|nr:hypoxanthine phosphoribosyltransferase [Elusimicrobium minutum]ACC98873.1 Hypoxanthine phosphoribosyltransferase [Elusimicrobium minutum Pei191]